MADSVCSTRVLTWLSRSCMAVDCSVIGRSMRRIKKLSGSATPSAARVNNQSRLSMTAAIPASVAAALKVGMMPVLYAAWTQYVYHVTRYN